MNPKLQSRLTNWKFQQACEYLADESEAVQDLVRALAALCGDSGWLDGAVGAVVEAALTLLEAYDAALEEAPDECHEP